MQIFIDSSDLDEIREALDYGVSGVTTNPTTMAKAEEGMAVRARAIAIIAGPERPVSLQVVGPQEPVDLIKEAKQLWKVAGNVVVKIPATAAGLRAVRSLCPEAWNAPVNVTLVFSPTQALIAAQNGAWCVSPFLCRWKDYNFPDWQTDPSGVRYAGIDFLCSIVDAVKGTRCKVLAASIRSVEDVEDAIEAGCGICTVSLKVLKQMMEHPKTEEGLAKFMADWAVAQK